MTGDNLFLSLIGATPTSGTITDGMIIVELTAPTELDGSRLGVDRLDAALARVRAKRSFLQHSNCHNNLIAC
jgi:hypothetical protein